MLEERRASTEASNAQNADANPTEARVEMQEGRNDPGSVGLSVTKDHHSSTLDEMEYGKVGK